MLCGEKLLPAILPSEVERLRRKDLLNNRAILAALTCVLLRQIVVVPRGILAGSLRFLEPLDFLRNTAGEQVANTKVVLLPKQLLPAGLIVVEVPCWRSRDMRVYVGRHA
jgi:hypothetical protein